MELTFLYKEDPDILHWPLCNIFKHGKAVIKCDKTRENRQKNFAFHFLSFRQSEQSIYCFCIISLTFMLREGAVTKFRNWSIFISFQIFLVFKCTSLIVICFLQV